MEWMLLPLKRYSQFSGRARPKEFWMFFLFMIIGVFVLSFVDAALGFGTSERWAEQGSWGGAAGFHNSGGLLTTLFVLAIIIPYPAVAQDVADLRLAIDWDDGIADKAADTTSQVDYRGFEPVGKLEAYHIARN